MSAVPLAERLCQAVHAPEWFIQPNLPGQVPTVLRSIGSRRTEACVDCQVAAATVSAWVLTEPIRQALADAIDRTAAAAPPSTCEREFLLTVAEGAALELSRRAAP